MSSQTLNRTALPIDPFLSAISETLKTCGSVIILAEPGAGKSTRVPVALMNVKEGNKQWFMLQPRRWAAKLVANRIAEENNFQIGNEVGYQIRFENRSSKKTKLIVMTEGVLLRKLLADPELSGVEGIILDEFHERSLDLDISLALIKELQESYRPDLKIVVMSATFDPASLKKYLPNSEIFNIQGRTFPVQKKLLGTTLVSKAVMLALEESNFSDGLVFLPGAYEIEKEIKETFSQYPDLAKKVDLLPLYSALPEKEQNKVFEARTRPAVIFATNIAETSITLPKIKWVVDSGLVKVMRNDPQLGQDRLELLRISKASSEQRAGRAGRVSNGTCYRLWNQEEDLQLRSFETPEVHRLNLSSSFLFLAAYGLPDATKLDWYERPKSSAIQFAVNELNELGFLSEGKLTEEGKKAAEIPLPPRFAKLKMVGEKEGVLDFAARLGAFLEDGQSGSEISDWEQLIRALNQLPYRALQAAKQIAGRETNRIQNTEFSKFEQVLLQSLKSHVFIQQKKVGRREVKGNRGAHLPKFGIILNSIEREEKGKPVILVRSFVPMSEELIKSFSSKKRILEWDDQAEKVRGREAVYFEDLALGHETDVPVTAEEASHLLTTTLLKDPEFYFSKDEAFQKWKKRLDLWNKHTDAQIALDWNKLIEAACYGKTKISDVLSFPWKSFLESSDLKLRALDVDLPERILVPSGSALPIDYESDPPKLAVRLQEVFGWLETPKLLQGKVPLLLELLSPGFKPIQLTRDLKSFWGNAYFEVKKELKARYPKHAWPDDPLTAKPEAKGRRKF